LVPVAAAAGGPILLSETGRLSDATATELQRLRPAVVILLGGTGAIGEAVGSQIKGLVE
jgi:putative cell wall-binding protein